MSEELDYLPARMVNEYVYCPRLFYLMHVEGQFADSVDTVGGRLVHRRVDSGSGGLAAASGLPAAEAQPYPPPFEADGASSSWTPEPIRPRRRQAKHLQPPTLFGEEATAEKEASQESVSVEAGHGGAADVFGSSLDEHSDTPPRSEGRRPEGDEAPAEPPRAVHARSVTLSSETLGVIAKMDLIEARGDDVTPVDYKRGRPRQGHDGAATAWDPERVQIALQGLLLRDNGYRCEAGVLYFNETRQRVRVPIDAALVEQTRAAAVGARQVYSSGRIPPPLVDSPKCPRCSLVGICLPDETRRLSLVAAPKVAEAAKAFGIPDDPGFGGSPAGADAALAVRPLVTARDERRPLYFNTQGMRIGVSGEVLQAKADGKPTQEVRLNEISQVNLFGNVQLTTQAVQTMLAAEVPVLYFTQRGWFYGATHGLGLKNIVVRQRQFRAADSPKFCLDLARRLVHGKVLNQRTMLMRNHVEPPADAIGQMKQLARRALTADSLASLLGVEGAAARLYFQNFAGLLKADCEVETAPGSAVSERRPAFDFRGRNRRPPTDPVNALLGLAYSLLTKDCVIAASAAGLDPHLGFYHQIKPGKPALALDVMEPMRPLIADSAVLSAINNRMVTPEHFIVAGRSVVLTDGGRRSFLMAYEQRMDTLVTHPLFDYRVSYRRLLEIQTRLLGRLLGGEIAEYPVFQTR